MYTTKSGQCWDEAAKAVYGNEKYAGVLMQANRRQLSVFVFPEGIKLETPEIKQETAGGALPWRTM
ncbi:MAG: phage tail protein [Eubacteriales bacterium]|nr:phage tail protein [Eubacteriales bacterium]